MKDFDSWLADAQLPLEAPTNAMAFLTIVSDSLSSDMPIVTLSTYPGTCMHYTVEPSGIIEQYNGGTPDITK